MSNNKRMGRPVKTPQTGTLVADIQRVTGWSQAELAEKLGVDRRTVGRYAAGTIQMGGAARLLAEAIWQSLNRNNTAE